MAMASSEPTPRRGAAALAGSWPLVARSWMFIAFFVGFFLFWEFSIDLFDIPRYILPKPSEIVAQRLGRYRPAPLLHLDHRPRDGDRLCARRRPRRAARPRHRLLVDPAADDLSLLRQPRDDAEDRLRAAVHLLARLRPAAQGHHRLPGLLLPDRAQRHPRLQLARARSSSASAARPAPSRWRTFLKVRLPAAMPQCFVGFKYAAINATVGATIAEFIGSDQGLGFYIQIVTGNMRPDLAFAGIFLLTLLGLALFGVVTLAERLLIPWHISVRRTADMKIFVCLTLSSEQLARLARAHCRRRDFVYHPDAERGRAELSAMRSRLRQSAGRVAFRQAGHCAGSSSNRSASANMADLIGRRSASGSRSQILPASLQSPWPNPFWPACCRIIAALAALAVLQETSRMGRRNACGHRSRR